MKNFYQGKEDAPDDVYLCILNVFLSDQASVREEDEDVPEE